MLIIRISSVMQISIATHFVMHSFSNSLERIFRTVGVMK